MGFPLCQQTKLFLKHALHIQMLSHTDKKNHICLMIYIHQKKKKVFVFETKVAQRSTPGFLVDWFYFNALK